MSTRIIALVILPLLLVSSFAIAVAASTAGGSAAGASTTNVPWAYQMQNQQNTGFSPETRINAGNVGSLAPVWTSVPIANIAGTPVVSQGIVYVAGPPAIYAINERTGALVWKDSPTAGLAQLDYRTAAGMTVAQNTVYTSTFNNSLVALNAKTGGLDWIVPINSTLTGNLFAYTGAEAAPLVWDGIVVVGETGGDLGPSRGVVQGFSQADGSHLWTFYTVPPGPTTATNQAAWGDTWGTNGTTGCYCDGGMVWNVPALDPKTGIIYFGTGNPYPTNDPFVREPSASDTNLYSESVIALNIHTGKMVWYHQEVNPEYFDWDQGMPLQLFYTTINHVRTEVVGAGGKAGFYFELNAATGSVIYTVSLGLHVNNDIPAREVNATGFEEFPGDSGGINTFSSYSPLTNMIYSIAANIPGYCRLTSGVIACNKGGHETYYNSTLYAIDASTGTVSWSTNLPMLGGGVSSADNLVFYADGDHNFYAANALTGAVLWTYHDPTGIPDLSSWGPPSIVDGYVIWETYGFSGAPGHVIAFSLGGDPPSDRPSSALGGQFTSLALLVPGILLSISGKQKMERSGSQ